MNAMYIAVNQEAMMTLGTVIFVGLLVLIAIPLLWALGKFIEDLITQVKNTNSELYEINDENRANFFVTYLDKQLDLQNYISDIGMDGYKQEQKKERFKKFGVLIVAGVILVIAAIVLFPWVAAAAKAMMVRFRVYEQLSFALFAGSLILALYYLCCKNLNRKRYKVCFVIAALGIIHGIVRLAGVDVAVPLELAVLLFLPLGVSHYKKWNNSLTEMGEILQYRLNEKRYADDAGVQKYQELQKLREKNGYTVTKMQLDNELDEMLLYLSWKSQS